MNLPLILVNFKLYEKGTGRNAIELAKIHQKIADDTGAEIAIAVNAVDLESVVKEVSIPVFVQHVDPVGYGSHTGHVSAEIVKEKGAYGTLLNHAEFGVSDSIIKQTLERTNEMELFSVLCAHTPEDAGKMMAWGPDLIAVEPPELIGGDVSVSKANPGIVEKSVHLVGENKVLVGAGVKGGEDVQIALALGASGVLVASGVAKVEDPYVALLDLVEGTRKARNCLSNS